MWQPVFMISGFFISIMGLAMLFPAAFDIYQTHQNWSNFITSAIVSCFIGLSLFLANNNRIKNITLQQGYLLTAIIWLSGTFLSSLPFIMYGSSFADALFEAASGITTTGATIFPDVEALPRSLLFWRALLSALGGVGIVIFAIALLPFLGIGGMQIFQRENSEANEKFLPKISYIAKRIILVYVSLQVICFCSLKLAGMNWFDALCHTFTTVATGGFSTKNTSIAFFKSEKIEWIITFFMFISAIPLTFYHSLLATKSIHSLRTHQVATFIKVLLVYISFMTCWLLYQGTYNFSDALRYASFNIVSIVTSTGFASSNYLEWGAFASSAFILFALTGGCTGSTSGSIKIYRWQLLLAQIKRAFIMTTEPNRMVPLKVGNYIVSGSVASSVFIFFSAYVLSVIVLTLCVALTGMDFPIAFSAVISCLTNSGPGIVPLIGPEGNYSSLSDTVKYILIFAMLLGRLEIMTILVILTKNFWR